MRFLACVLATLIAPPALAQDINETVTMEDLGFTQRLNSGARPMALGGAYAALARDAHALFYNPAGLVGVSRTEFHLGVQQRNITVESEFYDTPTSIEKGATMLDDIAFAYPVPTLRGRLVVAGGVYAAYSSNIDIWNQGFNTSTSTDDDYLLQQDGTIYSYNFGAAIDLAPTFSVGVDVFYLDGRVSALTQFTDAFVPPPPPGQLLSETVVDDALLDAAGFGATLGLLYQPVKPLIIGLTVATPVVIKMKGDAVQESALYFNAAPDAFSSDVFAIETDYKLPFSVTGGITLSAPHGLVSIEVDYANWTEAEINGRQIRDQNLPFEPVFRDVVGFRTGLEATLGPVSARGGYAYTPYPLPYLQADRITGSQLQKATIDAELQTLAAGIGVSIADAISLDASVERQYGERSIPTLVDTRESFSFVFAASYRL